jgi:hypothetical protein
MKLLQSLMLGWLPLLLAAAMLMGTGVESSLGPIALGLISVAVLYLVLASFRQGSDGVEASVDASETTHCFAGTLVRVHVDAMSKPWLRATDVASCLSFPLKSGQLARRFPKEFARANPALATWYVSRPMLSKLAAMAYREQTSRFIAWVDREILGTDRALSDATSNVPQPHPQAAPAARSWIARHWSGEAGLPMAVFGVGTVVAVVVSMLLTIDGPEDITLHYRFAAMQYLLSVTVATGLLYWWGRGVVQAAHRWVIADGSPLFAALAALAGFAAVGFAVDQAIDRERQYLLNEFVTVVSDSDSPARVWLYEGDKVVIVEGHLGFGTTNRFRELIERSPKVRLVSLQSYGGRAAEGFALMKEIADRRLNTLAWQECMSACTAAYLGGVERYATDETRFGFHRSGFHWQKAANGLNQDDWAMLQKMRSLQIDRRFIARALQPSIHGMYEPPVADAAAAGVVTEVWR